MAIDTIIAIVGGLALGGAALGVESLMNQPKSPSSTAPALPSNSTSNAAAASTVASDRAAMLQAGGFTDITGGLGVLTGSDTKTSTLIGGQ